MRLDGPRIVTPDVAEPELNDQRDRVLLMPPVSHLYIQQDIIHIAFCIFDDNIEISIVIKYARIG